MKTVNCVFEGGGIKGVSFIGCIKKLEEENIKIDKIAGTSVGALVATLLAAGYTSKEMEDILLEFNFDKLNGFNYYNKIPLVGKPISILTNKGMYSTRNLEKWIDKLLQDKGIKTFKDLKKDLKIVAADVTNQKLVVFPDDLKDYNYDDNFPIAKAVTMSCCIPIYFEPYKLGNNLFVDGGIVASFPIWLFKDDIYETLGFLIDEEKETSNNSNIIKYIHSIIKTIASREDFVTKYNYAATRTVKIMVDNDIQATDFNISNEKKKKLYEEGYQATKKFVEKKY